MSHNTFFLIVFALMCLQMFLGLIQVKRYRTELMKLSGTGTIGLGHRKGTIRAGQILILSYSKSKNKIVDARRMAGLTIFARFKEAPELIGLTLDEIRSLGLEEDSRLYKHRRKKHPYDPKEVTKKKGAVIQAVEAIDSRLALEATQAENKRRMKEHQKKTELEANAAV
ncbi:MAG: transcriptional regulator GutM [Eubacteriaceae bacterium]|jgi:glucitol operon activator protein